LTNKQILLQYDRYHQSESVDAAAQHVLRSILDTIEAARRARQAGAENTEQAN
jgi:Arc/MetJ family transcription regulator